MTYFIEIRSEYGITEHTFFDEKEALDFARKQAVFDYDNIVSAYKCDNTGDFLPWWEFIPNNKNLFVCPQCGLIHKINGKQPIICDCGCNAYPQ